MFAQAEVQMGPTWSTSCSKCQIVELFVKNDPTRELFVKNDPTALIQLSIYMTQQFECATLTDHSCTEVHQTVNNLPECGRKTECDPRLIKTVQVQLKGQFPINDFKSKWTDRKKKRLDWIHLNLC